MTYRVLNTRPMPMAMELEQALRQYQLASVLYPVVENKALQADFPDWANFLSDGSCHWVFISKPAVRFFNQFLATQGIDNFNPAGEVFGVGPSTKAELETSYSKLHVLLPNESNSEALLTMPELLSAKRVVLVKGRGGRGLIQQELQRHNIKVVELDLYQRCTTKYNETEMSDWLSCDLIMATSVDIAKAIFDNLKQLPLSVSQEFLQNKAWLVLSERIKAFLMQHSIPAKHIYVCDQSDNSSIIKLIQQLAK